MKKKKADKKKKKADKANRALAKAHAQNSPGTKAAHSPFDRREDEEIETTLSAEEERVPRTDRNEDGWKDRNTHAEDTVLFAAAATPVAPYEPASKLSIPAVPNTPGNLPAVKQAPAKKTKTAGKAAVKRLSASTTTTSAAKKTTSLRGGKAAPKKAAGSKGIQATQKPTPRGNPLATKKTAAPAKKTPAKKAAATKAPAKKVVPKKTAAPAKTPAPVKPEAPAKKAVAKKAVKAPAKKAVAKKTAKKAAKTS